MEVAEKDAVLVEVLGVRTLLLEKQVMKVAIMAAVLKGLVNIKHRVLHAAVGVELSLLAALESDSMIDGMGQAEGKICAVMKEVPSK